MGGVEVEVEVVEVYVAMWWWCGVWERERAAPAQVAASVECLCSCASVTEASRTEGAVGNQGWGGDERERVGRLQSALCGLPQVDSFFSLFSPPQLSQGR